MSSDPFKLPPLQSGQAPVGQRRDPLDDSLPSPPPAGAKLGQGFDGYLGLRIGHVAADRVEGTLDVDARLHQPYGIVHGGVYAAIVETLASVGAATWAITQGMTGAVGLSNTTDFLRSTRSGGLRGVALPLHQGRTQQLWQVEITNDDAKLVSHGQVRLQNITDSSVIGGTGPLK